MVTPSAAFSVNELILLAYKRAAILPVEARLSGANMVPKLEHGRRLLDVIMDNLAVDGFIARTMEFHDLPIVAGQHLYTLPDTILDVHEDAMFVPSDNTDTEHTTGELVCKQISVDTWQTLTTKGSESTRPQLYAAFRTGAQVQVRFWPQPTRAGTMRMKTVRLLGGNADGSKRPDLQRYWHAALIWMLAADLAVDNSMPFENIQFLRSMAATERQKCIAYAFEHTGTQAMVSYMTQWSR